MRNDGDRNGALHSSNAVVEAAVLQDKDLNHADQLLDEMIKMRAGSSLSDRIGGYSQKDEELRALDHGLLNGSPQHVCDL